MMRSRRCGVAAGYDGAQEKVGAADVLWNAPAGISKRS